MLDPGGVLGPGGTTPTLALTDGSPAIDHIPHNESSWHWRRRDPTTCSASITSVR